MSMVKNISPNVIKAEHLQELAEKAFAMFRNCAQISISERGCFRVALSGGDTPEGLFELLGSKDETRALEWDKIHVFWVDERCVSPEAEASNYGMAAHTFLDKVPIPDHNVHRMFGEKEVYQETVRDYENTIRKTFGIGSDQLPVFDLIILGMGSDGHIGSLFPNTNALFDTQDLVSAVYFTDGNYNRITLTHPVITAARQLLILISGDEKAEIVEKVLHSEQDEVQYPVHTLWPILHKVTWLIDDKAGKYI